MASHGRLPEQIAQDLCVSARTLRRWLRALVLQGPAVMVPRAAQGGRARFPIPRLRASSSGSEPAPGPAERLRANWTYAELAQHIHKELGIQASRRAVCNFCQKPGIRP